MSCSSTARSYMQCSPARAGYSAFKTCMHAYVCCVTEMAESSSCFVLVHSGCSISLAVHSHCFDIVYASRLLAYTTLLSSTLPIRLDAKHDTQRNDMTLHYTTLHYMTLHYTTRHCTTLRYAVLHYTMLHLQADYTCHFVPAEGCFTRSSTAAAADWESHT